MPRAGRTFEEGRTYHVYNRVGGGLLPFTDEELAKTFVDLFRKVMNRDSEVVLGWCLLGNHYHLVVRQGAVPLGTFTLQAPLHLYYDQSRPVIR
jgi:hypothetical protein